MLIPLLTRDRLPTSELLGWDCRRISWQWRPPSAARSQGGSMEKPDVPPFWMGESWWINELCMAMFNSYVKLPEGNPTFLFIYIYTWGKPLGGLTRNHPCMGHGLWVDLTIVRNELYLLGDSTWLIHHPVTPGSPGIAFFPWSIRLGGIVRQNCGLLGSWPFNKKNEKRTESVNTAHLGSRFLLLQSNQIRVFFSKLDIQKTRRSTAQVLTSQSHSISPGR